MLSKTWQLCRVSSPCLQSVFRQIIQNKNSLVRLVFIFLKHIVKSESSSELQRRKSLHGSSNIWRNTLLSSIPAAVGGKTYVLSYL